MLLFGLLVAACSTLVGDVPVDTTQVVSTAEHVAEDPLGCIQPSGRTDPVSTGELATDALHLSGEIFVCADDVVVVSRPDINQLATGAQLASALDAPLLLPHPRLAAEIGRLGPRTVHFIGEVEVATPPDAQVLQHLGSDAVELARQVLGVTEEVRLPAVPDSSTVVETVRAIVSRDRVVLPQIPPPATGTKPDQPDLDPETILIGLAASADLESVWLVDASDPATILLAAAMGRAADAAVVAAVFDDLFRYPELAQALAGYPDRAVRQVGSSNELDDWKLRVLAKGDELPGGGFELFPAHINRRFVAFYGNPASPVLGAMGMVTPQQALALMSDGGELTGYPESTCLPSPCRGVVPPGLLDGYAADGAHVVPTFNYIASVAQPRCRSHKFPIETFEDGILTAAEVGGYVVFDLQPGSESFLSHAQFYQDALRLPHVGLALDPEWHCGWPGQNEFDRVGTVTAAEVNEVIEWLADLVNEEALPQKLLLIQQFRLDMIQDRDQLVQRDEVQVVIQMDGEGQGNLTVKDNSWDRVTQGHENHHWRWGWKNFFARDHPDGPYSPEATLDREPVPVYISYQ